MYLRSHIAVILYLLLLGALVSGCHTVQRSTTYIPESTTIATVKEPTSKVESSTKAKTPTDYDEMRINLLKRKFDNPIVEELVKEASNWIGVPYNYGGMSQEGTDCSGFVMQIFVACTDIALPRNSRAQHEFCEIIAKEDLIPGDLVFFATGSDINRVSHVGFYIGNGEMIHASSSRGVIISSLSQNYYTKRFHSAGRINAIHSGKSHSRKSDTILSPSETTKPKDSGSSTTPKSETATSKRSNTNKSSDKKKTVSNEDTPEVVLPDFFE